MFCIADIRYSEYFVLQFFNFPLFCHTVSDNTDLLAYLQSCCIRIRYMYILKPRNIVNVV